MTQHQVKEGAEQGLTRALTSTVITRRRWRISVALVAALGARAHSQQAAAPTAQVSRVASPWSPGEAVAGVPDGASIRYPFLSRRADTVYVAANLFPTEAGAGLAPRPAIVMRVPGRPVPLPAGDFGFGYPKGVMDRAGTYHLFWSESTEPPAQRRFRIPTANSLWYAAYYRGVWTTPRRLLHGTVLYWTAHQGDPRVDEAGRLHVVLTASLDGLHNATVYLRKPGKRWETRELLPSATYATVVPWRRDTLVAAFIALDSSTQGAYSVFTSSSTDGGARWSQARPIASSGANVATAPALVTAGQTLHLVWAQSLRGGAEPEVLRHRFSEDGGRTWDAADDAVLLRDGALGFVGSAASCGATVALVESIAPAVGGARVVVDEFRWTGMAVRGARILPGDLVVASPGLIEAKGTFHFIGADVRSRGSAPIAIHATRSSCPP